MLRTGPAAVCACTSGFHLPPLKETLSKREVFAALRWGSRRGCFGSATGLHGGLWARSRCSVSMTPLCGTMPAQTSPKEVHANMAIRVGDRLPSITLMHMTKSGPEPITTDEIFTGKRVVLFAVPGAFTPTCSQRHLPGFVEHAYAFQKKGVDSIVCLAVNDAYVMHAWGKDQNVGASVLMVADGSAEFTEAVGLDEDRTAKGMGIRSQRYAMLVEDGVVKALNVEAPGEFEVSRAERVLELV